MSMYFSGKVHSVVFENIAQDFYILRMVLDQGVGTALPQVVKDSPVRSASLPTTVVRGHVSGMPVKPGTWFGFEGDWEEHPQYGNQIGISKAPILPNGWSPDTATKVLASAGVGPRIISDILDCYGEAGFLEALNDREKIQAVPGMTPFTAAYVVQRWQTTRAQFLTLDFLNDLGMPPYRVRQIWSVFGDTAHEVLSSNPWDLVRLDGFTFGEGDAIAQRLNLPITADNPQRVRGAVLYAVRSAKGNGHLFVTTPEVLAQVRGMIEGVTDRDVALAIKSAVDDSLVTVDKTTRPGTLALYEPWFYNMESRSAELVLERQYTAANSRSIQEVEKFCQSYLPAVPDLKEAIRSILANPAWVGKTQLSSTQMEGVANALVEPVSVLTGLPGTGKTTSMVLMVRVLQEAGIKFLLVAPTGIAAKKISSVTGALAYTIHRAFQAEGIKEEDEVGYVGVKRKAGDRKLADGSGETWGFDEDNPHSAEVVIVDESSMVDQHLMYRILSCTRKDCRLVFIGDAAQLPSVGPGNVLRDLIASKLFPTVSLTEIFRQEDTSDIIHASHDIFNGRVPDTEALSDFTLLNMAGAGNTEENTLQAIIKVVRALYEKKVNFQVLSPRHSGDVGVTNLNANLRAEINPRAKGLHEMKIGSEVLREGDRIMVVKNDYELGVYNGDMGKVNRLDKKNGEVEIKVYGPPVLHIRVPFKKVPTVLRLAYAVTVHKSQGQEFDVVVMPLVDSFSHQLQRNLLYTGVTRARQRVILLGTHSALVRAVMNDKEGLRNTFFLDRLIRGSIPASP